MSGGGIGLIKASKHNNYKEGDVIVGMVPWSTYYIADATTLVS